MNLQFKKITIDNFMSIGHAELDLLNRGVVAVRGKNKQDKLAESNGAGKSALTTESLLWVLTGDTNKGTKQINNIFIKDSVAEVTLEFSIDGTNYVITRNNNKKLTIIKDGQDISGNTYTKSKEILDTELGFLTKDIITSIIILGQGLKGRFSELRPADRKARLESIVGIDTLLENIQKMVENSDKQINTNITANNLNINEQNTIISTTQQVIDSYNNKPVMSEDEYKANLKRYNELADEGAKLEDNIKKCQNIINENLQKKNEINNKVITLVKEISNKKDEINKVNLSINNLTKDINNINTQLDSANKQECPLCHQHLSDTELKEHLKSELKNFQDKLDKIQKETDIDLINKDIISKEAESNNLTAQTNELQGIINDNTAEVNNFNKEINSIMTEYNKLSDYFKEYDNYKAETQSIDSIIKASELKIQEANKKLVDLKSEDSILARDKDINKFFKGQVSRKFRNFLLDGVFTFLNKRLEYYSSKLFTNYTIKLENKDNDINIKLGEKEFEALSGGESRKVDICIQCALRDLAKNQRGLSINLIVFDEIFDYLDSVGIEKISKFLEEEITDVSTTFITTHMKDVTIDYDSIIEVVKEEKEEVSVVREIV